MRGHTNRQFSWSSGRNLSTQITRTFLSRLLLIVAIPIYLGSLPQACGGGGGAPATNLKSITIDRVNSPIAAVSTKVQLPPTSTATPTPTLTSLASATPTPVTGSAADFLNHIGVSSHVVQSQTTCAQLQQGVQFLGVKHVRDDFTCDGCDPRNLIANCFIPTHQMTGVTFDTLPNCVSGTTTASMAFLTSVDDEYAQAGALDSVEECNEPNNQPFDYNGVKCGPGGGEYAGCVAFAQDFEAAVRADTNLNGIPVFSMSNPGAEGDNVGLQFLVNPTTGMTQAEFATLHNYIFGNSSSSGQVDNNAWFPYENTGSMGAWDSMDGEFCNKTFAFGFPAMPESQCPTVPRVTTETGWPSGGGGVSEDARGKMIINGIASAYARGVYRVYTYQLNDAPDSFGQYDGNFNPKLSAVYWHNMSSILADSNGNFPVTTVPVTVTGTSSTDHWFEVQKSDGTHWLVIWADRPPGELSENISLNVTPRAVFDPTVGAASTGTTLPALVDHMVIVEF